jgi:DNA topoisomerase-3
MMLEVNGKKGKMLVCSDRECGYRQNLSYLSNARCPNCHKKLEVFGEGEKKIYTCHCGFREKFDSFNKKLSENKNDLSKRDVQKYLANQQKEEPVNSAFAAALAKAMEKDKE